MNRYGVTIDDLKNFRQLDSVTPGHPENFVTAGIEVSTGPLGQGISNAVGMAMAERHMAATFNKPNFEASQIEGPGEIEGPGGMLQQFGLVLFLVSPPTRRLRWILYTYSCRLYMMITTRIIFFM